MPHPIAMLRPLARPRSDRGAVNGWALLAGAVTLLMLGGLIYSMLQSDADDRERAGAETGTSEGGPVVDDADVDVGLTGGAGPGGMAFLGAQTPGLGDLPADMRAYYADTYLDAAGPATDGDTGRFEVTERPDRRERRPMTAEESEFHALMTGAAMPEEGERLHIVIVSGQVENLTDRACRRLTLEAIVYAPRDRLIGRGAVAVENLRARGQSDFEVRVNGIPRGATVARVVIVPTHPTWAPLR